MPGDDLEPVEPADLEPVEPVDLEPADEREIRRDAVHRTGGPPPWIWIGAVVAVVLVGIAVASTRSSRRSSTPPSTPPSASTTVVPGTPRTVDAATLVGAQLGAGLEGVGSGRYAAVVQDRLYLYDGEAPPALVPLPDGNVRIVDASDGSLLVSTHLANVVVSTRPARATTLGAGVVALASSDGFWIVQPDGRVATDHGNRAFRVPAGMRLAGAVDEAFVGLQADSSWVLWTGTQTRPIAPAGYRLLAVSGRRVAFEHGCSSAGCRVDIADVRGGPPVETSFPHIPDFAAFSPDGSRLAMTSRLADLSLVDTRTGATIVSAQLGGPLTEQTMSRRFTWTADGRSLLVFDGGALDVVRAADGETVSRVVVDTALEQISALP